MYEFVQGAVPEHIISNTDPQVFLKILSELYEDIAGYIDRFPDIVDVDTTPEIFLPKLSYLVKYTVKYNIDFDIQREVIKRMLYVYSKRGQDEQIIMAATYGDDPNWLGDHMFLPNSSRNRTRATLDYTVDSVFTHNSSKHSSGHKFASKKWRGGILVITLTRVNDEIRDAIKKVIPAGIKFYFDIASELAPDEIELVGDSGVLFFGEWVISTDYTIDYSIPLPKDTTDTSLHNHSRRSTRSRKISGRQVLFNELHREIYLVAEVDDISDTDCEILVRHSGVALRSTKSAIRSGKKCLSGSRNNEVSGYASFRVYPIEVPYADIRLLDFKVDDYLEEYIPGVDVEVIKSASS